MPKLENWGVVQEADPYKAPECRTWHLAGNIYESPKHEDGKKVYTTPIVKLECREGTYTATTRSGTVYTLDAPDPAFIAVLISKDQNFPEAMNILRRIAEKQAKL